MLYNNYSSKQIFSAWFIVIVSNKNMENIVQYFWAKILIIIVYICLLCIIHMTRRIHKEVPHVFYHHYYFVNIYERASWVDIKHLFLEEEVWNQTLENFLPKSCEGCFCWFLALPLFLSHCTFPPVGKSAKKFRIRYINYIFLLEYTGNFLNKQ